MTDTPAPALTGLTDTPTDFPLWAREPAKIVGWIVTAVFVIGGAVVELLNEVVDVLPHGWQAPVRTAVLSIAAVVVIAGRVQTWMTRNGIGSAGNGKDGVWSPAAVVTTQAAVAQQVAAAKGASPETSAR
jgi:hypothetical protein